MLNKVKKIEILSNRDVDKFFDEHDIEKFMCSGDKCNETDNILRIAIYANYNLYEELAEQLGDSDCGFRLYGGAKNNKTKFVLLELF